MSLATTATGPRVAEFFAGIGLVRKGLEPEGFEVVFANDIDPTKFKMYGANFDAQHFLLGDVTDPSVVHGDMIPDIEVATASFPCTDLSLAGNRAGLLGEHSGTFWSFTRILGEMRERRPLVLLLENVPSLATSAGGEDLAAVIAGLNHLGYLCDLLVIDARHFVPQSRPRLFIIGSQDPLSHPGTFQPSIVRPAWVDRFVKRHPELRFQALHIDADLSFGESGGLFDVVERLAPDHTRWWEATRAERFRHSLSPIQTARLDGMMQGRELRWASAYRRTRQGKATWEIRADQISGCLRTARGGSSKQALVEAGRGEFRVRWMTPREYARLQGADEFVLDGVSENQALFGLGDAVCVPAISWLARTYLRPLVEGQLTARPMLAYA